VMNWEGIDLDLTQGDICMDELTKTTITSVRIARLRAGTERRTS
jgi:hypothetical protein